MGDVSLTISIFYFFNGPQFLLQVFDIKVKLDTASGQCLLECGAIQPCYACGLRQGHMLAFVQKNRKLQQQLGRCHIGLCDNVVWNG